MSSNVYYRYKLLSVEKDDVLNQGSSLGILSQNGYTLDKGETIKVETGVIIDDIDDIDNNALLFSSTLEDKGIIIMNPIKRMIGSLDLFLYNVSQDSVFIERGDTIAIMSSTQNSDFIKGDEPSKEIIRGASFHDILDGCGYGW